MTKDLTEKTNYQIHKMILFPVGLGHSWLSYHIYQHFPPGIHLTGSAISLKLTLEIET